MAEQNQTPGNKKKFRFGIGSVIDIVIILLILAAIAGIAFRVYSAKSPTVSSEKADYEIRFRVDSVSYMLPNYLRAGDQVYFGDSGKKFGILQANDGSENGSALAVRAANILIRDEGGNYISASYPGEALVDATGTVLASGYFDASGSFLLDGKIHVTPGETVRVRTELADFTLVVTEIEKH